jgi:hypothetical protein
MQVLVQISDDDLQKKPAQDFPLSFQISLESSKAKKWQKTRHLEFVKFFLRIFSEGDKQLTPLQFWRHSTKVSLKL